MIGFNCGCRYLENQRSFRVWVSGCVGVSCIVNPRISFACDKEISQILGWGTSGPALKGYPTLYDRYIYRS